MTDPLRVVLDDILAWVVDDHSSVAAAESSVASELGREPIERLRRLTAIAVEALVRAGLIEVGSPRGRDFLVDESPAEVIGQRVYDEWDADPYPVQIAIWMNATTLGEQAHEGKAQEALTAAISWARESAAQAGIVVATEAEASTTFPRQAVTKCVS